MIALYGVLGAAGLFALLAYTATRTGTRLETGESCQGRPDLTDSCSLEGDCDGCGSNGKAAGWWPKAGMKDGDRR